MGVVRVIRYETLAPHDESEILRYAGVGEADEATRALLEECIAESRECIMPALCFAEYGITVFNSLPKAYKIKAL